MMRKLGMFLMITLLVSLIPGVALAGGGVPAGLTLKDWVVGPNAGHATIGLNYSGGFSTDIELNIPLDPSWHTINDVRPILEAYKEGYSSNLGGSEGIMGTTIKYAPNVLAAMKVQNFNPSQVGGPNIPPSSTTLTLDQIAWLQKIGYSVQQTSQPKLTSIQAQSSTTTQTTKAPSSQTQTANSKVTSSPESVNASPSTLSKPSQAETKPKSEPAIGETIKTQSGPMTQEMVATDQQLAAQSPPSQNPANISTKVHVKTETTSSNNKWIWLAGSAVILILAVAAGRIIYGRHRTT